MLKIDRGVVEGKHGAGLSVRPGAQAQQMPQEGKARHYRPYICLDMQSSELDREGRAVATRLGIEYASAFDAMCDASGCLTRAGTGRGSISMFDDSHLTPQGAEAVAHPLAPLLFKH